MGSNHSQGNNNEDNSLSSSSDSDLDKDSDEYLSLESDMDTVLDDLTAFTADAAYTIPRRTLHCPNIDEINLLDNNLDYYEKVSLVYLLYENPEEAYLILQRPLDFAVRDWCHQKAQAMEKWNWKLLEALCIIKNYKVLRMMGHMKEDMKSTFLPNNNLVALHVNIVRKTLFCIFENLTHADVDRLIFALQKDLTDRHMHCYVNRDNLELTFLYLEKIRYISLTDLRNVSHLFKSIDMLTEYEHLKVLHEKFSSFREQPGMMSWARSINASFSNDDADGPQSSQNVRHIDNLMKQNLVKPAESKDKSSNHVPDTEDCYQIDSAKPGLLLVIDNENFYTECRKELKHLLPQLTRKLEDRTGTKVDKDRLQMVFQKLNYEVVIRDNITHDRIKEVIKSAIERVQHEGFSSLFVAILSHGDIGVIYGCNSIPIEISAIQEVLYTSTLSGKPKVLLIQACQGERLQEIDEEYTTDGNETYTPKLPSPRTSDMLVFYATIPNYSAIRHPKKGTWFIQSLCEKITSSNKDHFGDICLKVTQDVSNKRWGKKVMVPITHSTLTKKLYLTNEPTNFTFTVDSAC